MVIEIPLSNPEAENFRKWLKKRGHKAYIGDTTDFCVDGVCVRADEILTKKMDDLITEFRFSKDRFS